MKLQILPSEIELNFVCYKQEEMINTAVKTALVPFFSTDRPHVRVWDNSPKHLFISGADEIRHSRFNPSLARTWNWAIGQSKTPWVFIGNEDLRFDPVWWDRFQQEYSSNPVSMWFGPSRSFIFHRGLLELVGWFDENFCGNTFEDLDYVRRMNHAGVPKVYGKPSVLFSYIQCRKFETGRQLIESGNREYFNLKYSDPDTENFFCKPNFETPDFYPQRPEKLILENACK